MTFPKTFYLFCCFYCAFFATAQRNVYITDARHRPIPNVAIADKTTGKLLGLSNTKGHFRVNQGVKRIELSHVAYRSRVTSVQDTIVMESLARSIAEATATGKRADYYRLRCLVRNYQYADSTPVNVVDALVDFYVNAKGTKLKQSTLKLDVYKNRSYIHKTNIDKGTVIAETYGITHWILNYHIATHGKELYLEAKDSIYLVRRTDNGDIVGNMQLSEGGDYVALADLASPANCVPRTLFNRTDRLMSSSLEQHFPRNVNTANIRPYDMSFYRSTICRDTWTKKYPTIVPLTEIYEITVLERQRMSKEEYKKVDLDSEWNFFRYSKKAKEENLPQIPLPDHIQAAFQHGLKLLPYKK